jgi:outer membrane cobalamin receptor
MAVRLMNRLAPCLCLLCALQVAAEESEKDLFDMSLKELISLRVTSSTLTDKSLQNVPSAMTVFTRDDIRRMGWRRMQDVLNFVPGYQAYAADEAPYQKLFSSRGRRSGTVSREILVLLDGQRLNSSLSGGIGGGLAPSLENVERIEIIRGSGSAIYGSNAELGVINIITRSEREVSVEGGTNKYHQVSGQWRIDNQDQQFEIFALDNSNDGEAQNIQDPFTYQSINVRDPYDEREVYLRGKAGELQLSARWSEAQATGKYVLGYADIEKLNKQEGRDYFINLDWLHLLNANTSIDTRIFFQEQRLIYQNIALRTPLLVGRADIRERQQGISSLIKQHTPFGDWLLGAEYRQPDLYKGDGSRTNLVTDATAPVQFFAEERRNIRGYFAQYEYRIAPTDTSLIAGLRHDDYSDWGSHNSPRLGIIQPLNANNTFKLLYSEAFRAPSPAETVQNNNAIISNPDLKPETAQTTEFIWINTRNSGFFSVALFNTVIDDAIIGVPSPVVSLRSFANDYMTTSGIEFEWLYQFNERWSLRTTATDIFNSSQDINTEASKLFSAALGYSLADWTVSVSAYSSGRRRDEIDTDRNSSTMEYHSIGGRTLIGAHVAWHYLPKLEFYFHADNLLDKDYYSPAARYQNTEGSPGRGREVSVGLRWRFE